MKKSLFLIAVLFGIIQAHALDYISIQGYNSSVESVCMGMTDTITVSVDPTWESGLDSHSWILAGDVSFASGYGENSNPCKIVVPSDGYGKGRVSYKYKDGTCSSVEYFDVFKSFACPQGLEIIGPECIVATQDVVYSVDPMLTKNLGAQIGIDSYKWNVLESNQPFVHEILYVSSDSSSITFKVGQVDPQNPPVITVTVGQCNEWQLIKTLGNATPKPDLQDTMYLPVGFGDLKVGVINPNPDIEYTWDCPSFAIEPYGANGDSAIIHIAGQDADKTEFEVHVNATYTDITCNTSADTMRVVRTWGHTAIINKNNITDFCYTPNNIYTFAVEGELPINTQCDWRLPQGWNFQGGKVSNLKSIKIYPTSSAKLKDTLFVKPLDPHDTATPDTFIVHVRPCAIPVTRIKQDSCLAYNYEGGVYIDTTGLHMPEGVEFEWNASGATIGESGGTDTLRFTPNYGTISVQVRAKGEGGCDGEYTSYTITFKPQKPDAIVCPDCECISVNMPDTLRFYIANGLSTQTYSWNYTSNLTPHRINNDTIELITNGTPNAKDTVWVKAIRNNQDCPESDTIRQIISVTQPIVSIEYDGDDGSVRLLPRRPSGVSNKHWYLLYNGMVVQDAFDNDDGTNNMLSEDFWNTIGDIDQFAGYTIVFEYTLNNCQRIRITYGTVIASNFMPTGTITISELPQSAQNHIRKREYTSDKRHNLMLYPNPATNLLNIHMNDETPFDVHIINTEGEKVYMSTNLSHYAIDVSFLPIGTYIVMATRNGKRLATKKLIRD